MKKTVVVFVSKEKKIAVFQFPTPERIFLRLADPTSLEVLAVTIGKLFSLFLKAVYFLLTEQTLFKAIRLSFTRFSRGLNSKTREKNKNCPSQQRTWLTT